MQPKLTLAERYVSKYAVNTRSWGWYETKDAAAVSA